MVGYKTVREDFKDKYSGTVDNSPGKVVEKDRRDVDDDFRVACSTGLHVGGHKYVSSFGSGDDKFLEVEFSPADVVSVPCNEDKIRVCRYKVLREIPKSEVKGFVGEHYNLPDEDEDDYKDECCDDYCGSLYCNYDLDLDEDY